MGRRASSARCRSTPSTCALGIRPEAQRILVCKSAIGWQAAFGALARHHVFVDTPGICTSDLARLAWSKGQRVLFPLDPAAGWDGTPD